MGLAIMGELEWVGENRVDMRLSLSFPHGSVTHEGIALYAGHMTTLDNTTQYTQWHSQPHSDASRR